MKRETIISVFSSLCVMLFFANCGGGGDSDNDGPTLNVTPSNIILDAEGTSQAVSVSSNTSWTVQREDSWINCSPMDGSGGASIKISASKNTGEERSTRIKITDKTGRATAEIRITQQGAGSTPTQASLEVSKSSVSFSATGGNDSFTITSNTSWTVSSDQSWCTVSPTSGSNGATVTVKVDENKNTTSRSANITIKYENKSVTVTVSQSAADVQLSVSPTSLSYTEKGGSGKITITSNTDWAVSSNQTWCTVSPASGSNNGTVTVTVSANDSNNDRAATVTVKSGNVTREVSVTQATKAEDVNIGRDDYDNDIDLDNK